MNKAQYLRILAAKRECDFCPDLGIGDTCMKCKKVKPITREELAEFYDKTALYIEVMCEQCGERAEKHGVLQGCYSCVFGEGHTP